VKTALRPWHDAEGPAAALVGDRNFAFLSLARVSRDYVRPCGALSSKQLNFDEKASRVPRPFLCAKFTGTTKKGQPVRAAFVDRCDEGFTP